MSLVVGVDVGNTTTEVVVVDAGSANLRPVAWDRAPTRGRKGSNEAWLAAASLVRRLERRMDRGVDLVAAAPQHPVDTRSLSLPERSPTLGRLSLIPCVGATPGGAGLAAGQPRWSHDPPTRSADAVVLLVRPGTGFRQAVDDCRAWLQAGAAVRGVLVADDEGVLVAARLGLSVPVLDQVDVTRAATMERLAVEVQEAGSPLRSLTDPLRLSTLLGLNMDERSDAVAMATVLGDVSRAVVGLGSRAGPAVTDTGGLLQLRGQEALVPFSLDLVTNAPVGGIRQYQPPELPDSLGWDVDDLWAVGLREVASSVAARIDPATSRAVILAALHERHEGISLPAETLGEELRLPVHTVRAEVEAARVGAMTTPGASQDAVIVDLGGGTVDVLSPTGQEIVAAGGGELLSVAVSTYLKVPRGAADWAKRGPSSRVEAPQVLLAEDGTRTFLDAPARGSLVGSLVVPGPAGLLPITRTLAPAEWRALRLRLKQRALLDNLRRALAELARPAGEVVLVGGVAGDSELLGITRQVLPGVPVGIGNVAGCLGHRYAVAYGLAMRAVAAGG